MEEQKEYCNMLIANNNYHFDQLIKVRPSPEEKEKEDFEKQYQLMNLARFSISEDIDQLRAEESQIIQKLKRFSYLDERIELKMLEIKNLDRSAGCKIKPSVPIKSVPRTTGFLHLTEKHDRTPPIRPDRKRCQKRLINKGQIDVNYLQLVQEELLSSKKSDGMTSCGAQELNDLIKSMMQTIKHGNKKRVDEIKIYHEMINMKKTGEQYTAPEPDPHRHCYSRERKSKRDIDSERSTQHKIHIRLDDIENIKRDLSGRQARVRRLKAELEHVRKKVKLLSRELENVNSKRLEAYKCAYELGVPKEEFVL